MPTIRELREAQSLSQEKLGLKASLSGRTIARIENGEEVLPSTLALIAMALGVKPEDISGVNIVNRVPKSGSDA